ncbi:EF-P 5-aminopentanol modification-associated protein YfmF [Amphibacillus jilinensis]|uniref:EF-P 5-aminopentanol modification-associated protein YfmF n=1 Tax=Amphibacillus jilinensis TaxID=1216008 RepID=UPI0002E459B6|nr:pitrilysin family protein [Amphibacillus jilinensis]
MIELNEEQIDKKGYKLHIVNSKKFKTVHITAKFRCLLKRETVTKRALLPFVLQQGTKRYTTSNAFRRALDDLYGAVLSMDGTKKGEQHILTARMTIANQNYLSDQHNILTDGLNLFKEALFAPNVINNRFDPKVVEREKQTLKQKIAAIVDDKMHYANMRMIDEMCKEEPYHLHVHGYPDDLERITAEELYSYYQSVISEDPLDLYVLGDFESIDIKKLIGNLFDRDLSKHLDLDISSETPVVNEVKDIIEEQELQQGKLHFGYRTHTKYADKDYPALQVFNAIFGGFPSSKLFINVREKNSLAYYAASRFESHKGLLFVFSGIAPTDYDRAKAIILEQMEAMREGQFTEAQIDEAKRLIINQYKETLDDPFGMTEVLYNQQLADSSRSVSEFIDAVESVNHQAIVQMANKIELDTTYFLTAKGGQSNA